MKSELILELFEKLKMQVIYIITLNVGVLENYKKFLHIQSRTTF
jgi:hypothetical protein